MNLVDRFLQAIERKLLLFSFIVLAALYLGYLMLHEAATRPTLDFLEQLVPNLAATFVLFVGSYLFLKEIDRLREDNDRARLADALASSVLGGLRDCSHRIGTPERRPDRQQSAADVLQRCDEVWLMGKTLSFFVSQNKNLLIDKLRAGTKLKLLILCPSDQALLTVVSRTSSQTPEQLKESIERTVAALKAIQLAAFPHLPLGQTSAQLEVGFSAAPFNNGYTFIDPKSSRNQGRVFIEYFGVAVDLAERLSAVLPEHYDPDGFRYHREQFTNLWAQATPCPLT